MKKWMKKFRVFRFDVRMWWNRQKRGWSCQSCENRYSDKCMSCVGAKNRKPCHYSKKKWSVFK